MKRKCYIRTESGAYLCGWGVLTSNRNEARTYECFRHVQNDMSGFNEQPNNMWFEPIEGEDM
ncbi:MAG: hypothetical protein ACRCX2_20500 [Paraclostridium sp.]